MAGDERSRARKAHLERDCIVIGAGPGGLGSAALLKRQGLDVVILERGAALAPKWRAGYDRLRINTSSWFSYLPGERFPREWGRWPTRDQLVSYYEGYAHRHELEIKTHVDAQRVARRDGQWEVTTPNRLYRARAIVVATGKQNTPVIPDWPGRPSFEGTLIHAAEYRDATPYGGMRALVVGIGNSGMDIALDLVEGGAELPLWLSVRRPPHIGRREVLGLPHDLFGVGSRHVPRVVTDFNAKMLRRLMFGDLSALGLPVPDDNLVTRLEEGGRVPTIDAGDFIPTMKAGQIKVVPAVRELERRQVLLSDGERLEPELVVAATGYRSNLEGLVGHLGVLDGSGMPTVHGGETHPAAPNLYFIGYRDPRSGLLRELRLQAGDIARAVARARTAVAAASQ